MYTKEELKSQLRELGIRPDDTVLVHTSFKAVGGVVGGPDAFIDAFCEYLCEGLFIIPTHTWANVTSEQPIFNYKTTEPCIGLVPRTAAKRQNGIRSLHPTHSVWAYGRGAEEFVFGEEHSKTPAPVGGSWWKLGELGAKILLIGVDHGRNTYIHAVDEIAGLDDRLDTKSFDITVIGRDGEEINHTFTPHGNTGSENFNNFEKAFLALGVQYNGKLGDALVRVVDAAKCRDVLLGMYEKNHENFCLEKRDVPEWLWKDQM